MASCVAVLSPTNGPLFITSSDPSRALADQYSLHTSLDVIEEKTLSSLSLNNLTLGNPGSGGSSTSTPTRKHTEQSRELYLGVLFATEKQKVYGFVTNTRVT